MKIFEMTFAKANAALDGFNQWTINGVAYPSDQMMAKPCFTCRRESATAFACAMPATTSIPIHLHRHSFELTKSPDSRPQGCMKDVVMVGGYQEAKSTSSRTIPA